MLRDCNRKEIANKSHNQTLYWGTIYIIIIIITTNPTSITLFSLIIRPPHGVLLKISSNKTNNLSRNFTPWKDNHQEHWKPAQSVEGIFSQRSNFGTSVNDNVEQTSQRPKDGNPKNIQTFWRAIPATIARDIAYERTKADTYRLDCARDFLASDWSRFLSWSATDEACALSGVSAEMLMLLMLLSLLLRFCCIRSGERRRASWQERVRREHGSWIRIYGQTLEVSFCIWPSWKSTSSRRGCRKELPLIQWWNNPLYHFLISFRLMFFSTATEFEWPNWLFMMFVWKTN